MSHLNCWRIVPLMVCVLVAAAFFNSLAEEKNKSGTPLANAQTRRDAARKVYEGALQRKVQEPENIIGDVDFFHDWSVRWMQAERDLGRTKAEKMAALEGHLKRMEFWKSKLEDGAKGGQVAIYEASAAEFFRLEAEDWRAAALADGGG